MNSLNGIIKHTKTVDGITHIHIEVENKILSSLILSNEEEYKEEQLVNLFFKETEVMIATKESIVSARNSFVSPITFINIGESSLEEVLEQKILKDSEKEQISKSIILELYDKDPKNWLFGQEFN